MDYELFVNAKDLSEELRDYFRNQDIISVEEIINKFEDLLDEYKEFKEEVEEFYVYKPDKHPEPREYGDWYGI